MKINFKKMISLMKVSSDEYFKNVKLYFWAERCGQYIKGDYLSLG